MRSCTLFLLLLLLATAGALAFRLPRLGRRPMHADEAVQAEIFRRLWIEGRYVYNPYEFHGPTLPGATLPSVWLESPGGFAQTTKATYRVVPAVFGAALVLLLGLLGDGLGKAAAVCAALWAAVSPGMVFYSRYYIHETLLVFFTLAALAAAWRYRRTGKLGWCLAAGACLGLMQATKETCALVYLAMAIGLAAAWAWGRLVGERPHADRPRLPRWHLAAGLLAAILVAATLLSSFFTNPQGPLDGLRTYLPWLERAGGQSPHVHPWCYYLRILTWWRAGDGPVWSEGPLLALALAGFIAALLPRGDRSEGGRFFDASLVRWLGFYTLALAALYSLIPYKTPWCLLGFLHGATLLAGVGAVALVRAVPTWTLKGLIVFLLLAGAGHLAGQAHRASYAKAADPDNPYMYAPTLPDVERLAADVHRLAAASPHGRGVPIHVVWHDRYYWPLPWYLRGLENRRFHTQPPGRLSWTPPGAPAAPIVISSPQHDAALTERLDPTHLMTGYYGLRPNVLAQLWVPLDLWRAHLRRTGRL